MTLIRRVNNIHLKGQYSIHRSSRGRISPGMWAKNPAAFFSVLLVVAKYVKGCGLTSLSELIKDVKRSQLTPEDLSRAQEEGFIPFLEQTELKKRIAIMNGEPRSHLISFLEAAKQVQLQNKEH